MSCQKPLQSPLVKSLLKVRASMVITNIGPEEAKAPNPAISEELWMPVSNLGSGDDGDGDDDSWCSNLS